MPDQQIFCNTPWYELHVYWDGGLGICCQEDHKLYPDHEHYNIASTSISDWFNSPPVRQFRSAVLGDRPVSACRRCYVEERHGGDSRRLRANTKSVIFTRQAFDASFQQSPGRGHFDISQAQAGLTDTLPIDLHVDLGNFCNLACKMCNARTSSTIASQEVRWGTESSRQYVRSDWTRDQSVWQDFLQQILAIPQLRNIHFMGGETLLTPRLEQLVDHFISHERFDVCFSFVTNGTVYRPELMAKLAKFSRVGIEISIETMTEHNSYQRQGTDNYLVRRNIDLFQTWTDRPHMTVALRPAPSILTIGQYHTLLDYAIGHQLVVKSNLCLEPEFMRAEILPTHIKQLYLERLEQWAATMAWPEDAGDDFNSSDPNNVLRIARKQLDMIQSVLRQPRPDHSDRSLEQLTRHCERWDREYGLDARELYPEFQTFLDQYGYHV